MTDPGVHVIGAEDLAAKFRTLADDIKGPALEAATRAQRSRCSTRWRITEPEGGRTPYKTGTYRRDWHLETVVKTPERLHRHRPGTISHRGPGWSLGSSGADKLGRIYNQGRPAAHPARHSMKTEAQLVDEFRAAVGDIIRRRG